MKNKKRINEIVVTPANGGGNVYYLPEDLERQRLFTKKDIIRFLKNERWKPGSVQEARASHCPTDNADDDETVYILNSGNNTSNIFYNSLYLYF